MPKEMTRDDIKLLLSEMEGKGGSDGLGDIFEIGVNELRALCLIALSREEEPCPTASTK